jgi:hypothetical protein
MFVGTRGRGPLSTKRNSADVLKLRALEGV